jgi:Flp pilus assembly CpaE family ATPase
MIGKWEKLDVLHAGELTPPADIEFSSLQRVLATARSQYEVICADLGSSLDPFSLDFMRESRRIFVVATPEIVPIHFAVERIRSLEKLGLADRARLLVNRKSGRRGAFEDEEVARLVGLPITFSFSNDYAGVEKSILDGSPVARDSGLGQSVLNLAHSLAPHAEVKEPSKRRKFLEFFHVPSNLEESGEVPRD